MDESEEETDFPEPTTPLAVVPVCEEVSPFKHPGPGPLAMDFPLQQQNQLIAGYSSRSGSVNHIQITTGIQAHSVTAEKITINMRPPKRKLALSFRLIDSPIPNFTGRKEYLGTIHKLLLKCSTKTNYFERIVIIHGIGGIGKSELVRQYVKDHIDDPMETNMFRNVAWINAETRESSRNSFTELAEELNLPNNEKMKVEQIAKAFYKYFSDNIKNGLIIFDNVEQFQDIPSQPYFGILKLLPTQQLPYIPLMLITTRTNDWEFPDSESEVDSEEDTEENIIPITELYPQESFEFLIKSFRLNKVDINNLEIKNAIQKLAKEVQGYPLGLSLAASNIGRLKKDSIQQLQEEIEKYIQKLNEPKSGWINQYHKGGALTQYELIMNNVWEMTFEKIQLVEPEGKCALKLLNILAYVSTDNLVATTAEEMGNFIIGEGEDYAKGLDILETYSLISKIDTSITIRKFARNGIRIHRHVQRCTREKLDYSNDYTYLFAVCKFFRRRSRGELILMHNHLKQRNWPQGSISLSIIFISPVSLNEEDLTGTTEVPIQIIRDVHEWLITNKSSESPLKGKLSILFHVWIFYFCMKEEYSKDNIFKEYSRSRERLQQYFVDFTKLYVEQLHLEWMEEDDDYYFHRGVNLEEPLLYLQDFTDSMKSSPAEVVGCRYFNSLWQYIYYKTFSKLDERVKEQVGEILTTALDSYLPDSDRRSLNKNLKDIRDLCLSLRTCYLTEKSETSILYLQAVTRKHLLFYETLEILSWSHAYKYWQMDPLNYSITIEEWNEMEVKKNEMFADSFFAAEASQLLVDHFTFLCLPPRFLKSESEFVLSFVLVLARMPNKGEKFVQAMKFMRSLLDFTKHVFGRNEEKVKYTFLKFLCLLIWFAIFDGNRKFTDMDGAEWSLESVKDELNLFAVDSGTPLNDRLFQNINGIAESIIANIFLFPNHAFHNVAGHMQEYLLSLQNLEFP